MHLKGKRVVVTGGSSGIGWALPRAILARGARVAIVGRRQVELDRAVAELKVLGPNIGALAADVSVGHAEYDLPEARGAKAGQSVLAEIAGSRRGGRMATMPRRRATESRRPQES